MWQEQLKPHIESGEVVAVGVVQEQHPDRTRLYRQWRELEWPIFVDSMNTIEHIDVVPVPVGLDANGAVFKYGMRPDDLDAFLAHETPERAVPDDYNFVPKPDLGALRAAAESANTADAWLALGRAYFNYGDTGDLNAAVDVLAKAVKLEPNHGHAHFALGVALRRRYETESERQPGDAQAAVDHWATALEIDPNNYIWRRRLQQYGPRLDKPYNFYFWVEEARKEIRARGEEPLPLTAEPMGSELAPPERAGEAALGAVIPDIDPEGRINRDERGLVQIETLTTPPRVAPGNRARIRATFRLDPVKTPWWNNEADPLRVWIGMPEGFALAEPPSTIPNPETPETQELRQLEFEVAVGEDAPSGEITLPAYALYYVCEHAGGVCYYLRQDFEVPLKIDAAATALK